MKLRSLVTGLLAMIALLPASAQLYTGMSGLLHVPSAEMNAEGDARIGVYFLNKEFAPASFGYHTMSHYLSITPFSWVEIGYACTLLKTKKTGVGETSRMGYYDKDRHVSVKLRPLKEGKWWPAVVVGSDDPTGTRGKSTAHDGSKPTKGDGRSLYFSNFYVAATKHVNLREHSVGFHAAYRRWKRDYNRKWNGIVGGITWQPSFAPDLRAIAEYTGDGVNVGADCLLWKHLFLQAVLQDGKYFSGGVCFQINLF